MFISCDNGQKLFNEYYAEMGDWLATPYRPTKVQEIKRNNVPFQGIPSLIVLNKDGTVKSSNGRRDVVNKGPGCVADWLD